MLKTFHRMWLNPTQANYEILEMLQFNGADVRVFPQGYAVQFPEGTRRVERRVYKQNAEGTETDAEHIVFEVPTGTQFRYMRRVIKEPVGLNDTLIIRQSKVVLNVRHHNLQEA